MSRFLYLKRCFMFFSWCYSPALLYLSFVVRNRCASLMGGTPPLIIGCTCDTLFKRLVDFRLVSHFCFVFLFEEWVLEIVCSHFCCHNSTNPISNSHFFFFFFLILYYIDPIHNWLHFIKLIFSLLKPILWSVLFMLWLWAGSWHLVMWTLEKTFNSFENIIKDQITKNKCLMNFTLCSPKFWEHFLFGIWR